MNSRSFHSHNSLNDIISPIFKKNLKYIKLQKDPKLIKEGFLQCLSDKKKNQFLTCNENQQSFAILPIKIMTHIIRA